MREAGHSYELAKREDGRRAAVEMIAQCKKMSELSLTLAACVRIKAI